MFKLKEFASSNEIDWDLSGNPNAIHLLEKNPDKICWHRLSGNPNAIHILEKNPDKIDWELLSTNPNAIHLLEKNPDKIEWDLLSGNPSIFELDYNGLKEYCSIYKDELLMKALHPSRIEKYLDMGISMEELDNYI